MLFHALLRADQGTQRSVLCCSWQNTCSTWLPAEAAGLTFDEAFFRAGDFAGENTDSVYTPFVSESIIIFFWFFQPKRWYSA